MRGFILIALIAVVSVSGRPEAPLSGYNYQPAPAPAQHHHSGGHQQSGGYSSGAQNFGGNSGYSAGGSSAGGSSFGGNQGSFSGGQQGGFSGGQQGGFSGSSAGPQQTIVQKHIYVHVPPPEEETQVAQQQAFAAAPRKHYKIIFIKAPSAPSISQQVAAAQAQNSEKTLIYVLVKKPEEINYEAPEQASPLAPSKPEVYFIKYKTQKEQGVSSAGASSFTGASGSGFGSSGSGGDFSGSSSGSTGSGFASSGSDYAAPAPQSSYGVPHKK